MGKGTAYRAGTVGLTALLALAVAATTLVSCESLIYEDNDDCHTDLRVKFAYDYNMKYADAFSHEVRTVHLYAYDESGALALDKAGTPTGDGYTMDVNELQPGRKYDFYVWAEGESRADTWTYGSPATASGLTATLSEDGSEVTRDVTPLFHGTLSGVEFAFDYTATQTVTVPLVKNTNNVIVALAQQDGSEQNADDYVFSITDSVGNTHYAFDNAPLPTGSVSYSPWSVYAGTVGDEARSTVSTVLAEFTLGRLMANRASKDVRLLVADRATGAKLFSIPLVDYLLLVKGNYNDSMSDQEYLDREDTYRLTFFLSGNRWLNAYIMINSWRVVPPQNADL